MEPQLPQFTGSPCGQCGAFAFYRGFRFSKDGASRELRLGDFFFVRISSRDDPCIGELQLLCANKNNEQQLSALRLYFLPEQTPDGRLPHHGEDEVLVASDRVVLRLDDLVGWITEEVDWSHGILTPKTDGRQPDGKLNVSSSETKVLVLSYQKYCRFRTILRRVENSGEDWLQDQTVIALGGLPAFSQKTRILFCRENFDHDELAHHELNCEYLAPSVKGKKRKKKVTNTRSTSPESNSSEESKLSELKINQKSTGIKQPPVKTEQEFLQKLFGFMKQRNTPIHRVPHLGFKQIDLYLFYSFAQKLGGYDKITSKRLWKHVYDELGGNPGSTSAATCTRRHYERLLLPFERFMEGLVYKPAVRGKKSKKKTDKENSETPANSDQVKTETLAAASAEVDLYNFTDSNHENSNSKDSNSNSACDEQGTANDTGFSDEDSKTVWSIQNPPENKEDADKDEKAVKPLIIQKTGSETFAEKERKWDEIRRKNAAARKWVRQSRSTKNLKTVASELPHFNGVSSESSDNSSVKVKAEISDHPVPTTVPTSVSSPNQLQDSQPPPQPSPKPLHSEAIQNVINKLESQKKFQALQKVPEKRPPSVKSEPAESPPKSWKGDSTQSEHSFFQSTPENALSPRLKNGPSSWHRTQAEIVCHPTGRQSVGSMSVSSVASGDMSANEDKPQRRPSVIQHTEHASASPSPKLTGGMDVPVPKETHLQFGSPTLSLPPNQLGYSMNGKVAEWLTKGVHEAVACKTPSSTIEKPGELHDKVMMPSSCRTPGIVGTGKIPAAVEKNKVGGKTYPKSPRSKYATPQYQNSNDAVMNGSYAVPRHDVKNRSAGYQKTFHPANSVALYNNVMNNCTSAPKYPQSLNSRPELYSNNIYNQQKRFKCNNMPPLMSGVGSRPSLLPFVRQQAYRPAPLSDIPKTTTSTHNDNDSVVLDLSVKKQTSPILPLKRRTPSPTPDGVLDLSVKKSTASDNGIENITPPLPLSPNPSYMSQSAKPPPSFIAVQDLQSSRLNPPIMKNPPPTLTSLAIPSVNAMYPVMTHSKMPQNIVNTMSPIAYSKEIAKSLYMSGNVHPSQFSPYVIPPFFPAAWTSPVNVHPSGSSKQTNGSQPSPMLFKGMLPNGVFPKDYPSQFKSQFHPVLCKDNNGHYSSNGK